MIKDFSNALVAENIISAENLKKVEATTGSGSLIYKLFSTTSVDEEKFYNFYQKFADLNYISINSLKADESLVNLIDPEILRRCLSFPLNKTDDVLTVAMADPLDFQAISLLEKNTGCRIDPVLMKYSEITKLLDAQYGIYNSVKNIVAELETSELSPITIGSFDNEVFQASAKAGPINKMLHLIISHALREKSSDIHFEQSAHELQCRFRIDGVLHKFLTFPKNLANPLVSSIKILGKMDIAEKRLPLDGSFQVKVENKIIDIRVSSFPTVEGEKIALRILDKENLLFSLDKIGLSEKMLEVFQPIIKKNNGIVLVTGPTGSGKTTTLYAVLESIKSIEKNIMTIEDPVEYHLNLINQSQVNVKAGLTFARGLRSFLRQDPDIILVGEIRDRETAEIAFQAALTGHLVLSTLHTNDAASSLTRLRDMGVENYLLSSSTINGILAQRLVRRICPQCQEEYQPDPAALAWLNLADREYSLRRSTGCEHCKNTGFAGRLGLFELLVLDEEMNVLIHENNFTAEKIKQIARQKGMITFQEDARDKVLKHLTSLEEVMRVLR